MRWVCCSEAESHTLNTLKICLELRDSPRLSNNPLPPLERLHTDSLALWSIQGERRCSKATALGRMMISKAAHALPRCLSRIC